ncbi:type II CAAX endopeptidase family protein [Peptoniphilus sp. oral taxon 386]|uniref:type II CAAX endopeptidase family protein n=1 Tax=Peptoniphilus sp. oral taxon 386 TaxID=652713 RepID=UPI0001DAA41C|nr:type II CAAX endopeptidase family protein [Peptoniphilus sp. oral taxon 386]EFI41322.1 CAAX amino terminal protease family protein [Peptoniphilus sp. oral taxon 386 str. F0131]
MKKYKKKNLNVLSVNTFTLVLSIFFLTIGYSIQSKSFLKGTFINEVFIILIPALLLCGTGKRTEVLRIKKLSSINVIRVIIIVILSYPIILLINGIFLNFLSTFIELKNFSMDMLLKDESLSSYLFFMCIVPAICEEVFFRGALINSYDVYGGKFAILMSSLVFALFHFDIQNFIAPLLLGIIFGNLLELTGSLFASILGHFTNNLIAIFATKYLDDTVFTYLKHTDLAQDIGSLQLYIIILLFLISIVSMVLLRLLFKQMDKEKRLREERLGIRKRVREIQSIDFFNFVPILALIILYFIYYAVVF